MIGFWSSFASLPLAVDAATMLGAFHSYCQELHHIGQSQPPGSQRRKAALVLAKWLFDTGDRGPGCPLRQVALGPSVATEQLGPLC